MLQTTFGAVSVEPADVADFLLGAPLRILAIVIIAWFVNRIARRGVKSALRTLSSGAVQERVGSLRAATPNALLQTQRAQPALRAAHRRAHQRPALARDLRDLHGRDLHDPRRGRDQPRPADRRAPASSASRSASARSRWSRTSCRGVFILVEDQFGVGDIVDLDGQTSGTVDAVSLRTTRLRSVDGTLWHVPNGEIRRVGNKSQHWSRALIDIEVAYDTDIDHAEAVIARVAARDRHRGRRRDRGARGLGRRGARRERHRDPARGQDATIRAVPRLAASCAAGSRPPSSSEGIEIPFPQQTVWHRPMPVAANGNQN